MSQFKKLYQAPLPAIIALLIVYIWQGLGHTVMYLMEHKWFPDSVTTVCHLRRLCRCRNGVDRAQQVGKRRHPAWISVAAA
jgi:hypothetical protein